MLARAQWICFCARKLLDQWKANRRSRARSLTIDLTLLGIGAIIGAGLFSSIKEMIVGPSMPTAT